MSDKLEQVILASAWIFGGIATRNEYALAETAANPLARASHLDKATTMSLASNVAAGVLFYRSFKTHPKLVTAASIFYFGGGALTSWLSASRGSAPRLVPSLIPMTPPVPSYSDPINAGWGRNY
jgi:hypothetical protein